MRGSRQKSPVAGRITSRNSTPSHTRRFRRLGVLVASFVFLLAAASGWADYVGSLTNRIFLDPATIPDIIDGYQNGDEIAYILETTPRDTGSTNGVAAWMTLYIPAGVEVIGASFVTQAIDGSWVDIDAEDGDDTYLDCGSRNCDRFDFVDGAFEIDDGSINGCNHDSGIFYSTDSRTANTVTEVLPAVSPTGPQTSPRPAPHFRQSVSCSSCRNRCQSPKSPE